MRKICKNCGLCSDEHYIEPYRNENTKCVTKGYIKRNNVDFNIDGWSKIEIIYLIDSILNMKYDSLNELAEFLKRELKDIVLLLTNNIKIYNKPLQVKTRCAECGEPKSVHLSRYKTYEFQFCSYDCYWKYKTHDKRRMGVNNNRYSSELVNCSYCNKELLRPKYKRDEVNSEGKNHLFCSRECYSKFRKVYYVGERCYQFGTHVSDEMKRQMSLNTLQLYKNGVFDRETKPQKAINKILDDLGILYEREEIIGYYAVDNYLLNNNLIIEVMGDYFHTNPIKFQDINSISNVQRKGIVRDKRKKTYISKYRSINILYLWETDIKNNPLLCSKLIQHYITNKGVLSNYHSFNYSLNNNELEQHKNISVPYFETA